MEQSVGILDDMVLDICADMDYARLVRRCELRSAREQRSRLDTLDVLMRSLLVNMEELLGAIILCDTLSSSGHVQVADAVTRMMAFKSKFCF